MQQIKQMPAARVSQRFEDFVDVQLLEPRKLKTFIGGAQSGPSPLIWVSFGLGVPFPVSTSDFKLIR